MNVLIKSAQILDKTSPHHQKKLNIHIKNGRIAAIGKEEPDTEKLINAKGMVLSTGWFDMCADFCDPGFEFKEDLSSGSTASASGGFNEVALVPNTHPAIQTKNDVSFLLSRNGKQLTGIHCIGAVTKDTKGEELTEMIDLRASGAVAFSDGKVPIWHTDILLKTLQYLQKFDGLLINRPEDKRLNLFGTMHEGPTSTLLGMTGMPSLSEELMILRDLEILAYAGGRLHFSNISAAKSVDLIRKAKKKGLPVTCDVTSFQALIEETALEEYDTNYKVNPPFRSANDNKALIKGLKDGTIDVVVSGHTPQDEENKKLEFDLAAFGMISLQTVAANLATLAAQAPLEDLIDKLTTQPRTILGLPIPKLEVGEPANLTLFDPSRKWTFDQHTNLSKSVNSPFLGKELEGKAVAVFNNGKSLIDKEAIR